MYECDGYWYFIGLDDSAGRKDTVDKIFLLLFSYTKTAEKISFSVTKENKENFGKNKWEKVEYCTIAQKMT